MRQALQQQLASNQMEDKARTCAALELLCGILAAGHVYSSGGGPPCPMYSWKSMGRQQLSAWVWRYVALLLCQLCASAHSL